jgi:hypothetical protein
VGAGVGVPTCPRQQPAAPAVTAAGFTALYDHCLESGLKARLGFSAVDGGQSFSVSCYVPVPASTTAAAGKRRRRHHRRRKRGRAATSAPEGLARVCPPSVADAAAPSPPPTQATSSPPSPEIASPPAKKTSKRRNEIELLRDCDDYDGDDELLLSPPPSRTQPASSTSTPISPPHQATLPPNSPPTAAVPPVPI